MLYYLSKCIRDDLSNNIYMCIELFRHDYMILPIFDAIIYAVVLPIRIVTWTFAMFVSNPLDVYENNKDSVREARINFNIWLRENVRSR